MDAFDDVLTALAGPASVVHGLTQARVLQAIARQTMGGVRRDLAHELRISPGTVSKAVALAKDEGLVEEQEPLALRPGRPLVPLTLSSTGFAMIGVAVIAGGDHPLYLMGTIIGLDGNSLTGFDTPRRHDLKEDEDLDGQLLLGQLEEFLRCMISEFDNLREAWPGPGPQPRLLGCGVNLSGHIDHERGVVRSTGWGQPTDQWTHPDLSGELERRLHVTVTCDNDVSSLAVRLNLRPYEDKDNPSENYALLAALDHGVGGALVLHHRTRRGHDSMAGEPGHIPVGYVIQQQPDDDTDQPWTVDHIPYCHCESREDPARGHVQAFAAPDSIIARANSMQLHQGFASDAAAELSARPRSEAAISRIFYQGGAALGRATVSVINWVNPGRIVLYLPPALAETNPFLAGHCYQLGLMTEIAQSAFSVNYLGDRIILKSVPETEMKERLAMAAAYLVFARLLEALASRPRKLTS